MAEIQGKFENLKIQEPEKTEFQQNPEKPNWENFNGDLIQELVKKSRKNYKQRKTGNRKK